MFLITFRKLFSRVVQTRHKKLVHAYMQNGISIGRDVLIKGAILQGNNVIGGDTSLTGKITIGRWTTLGHHNTINSGPCEITIGNFCQFGPYVSIYASYHPMTRLTTYQNGKFLSGAIKVFGPSESINIGSDVWIGHGSIILKGVDVGTGAIIGSGSIVTRAVPEYSIVAGNPAQVVGKRFPDSIIERIKQLEWWKYEEDALAAIMNVFKLELTENEPLVIEALEEAKQILEKYPKIEP